MAEYIEREALKEHLKTYAGMFTDQLGFAVNLQAVLNGIDFQPAAEVAPVRHSRWVHCFQQDGETVGQCYECHAIRFVDRYCPNCGAKMD